MILVVDYPKDEELADSSDVVLVNDLLETVVFATLLGNLC